MLIGICGGIGSGKSVVSRIVRELGYEVLNCDIEARRLMESSEEIKRRIRDEISAEVTDGISLPNRKILAEIVFNDENARLKLNEIVHGALKDFIRDKAVSSQQGILFAEAALMAESGLAAICDSIWEVKADSKIRLERIIRRDGCSEEHAIRRIASQRREEQLMKAYAGKTVVIENFENKSLLDQVTNLLETLKK